MNSDTDSLPGSAEIYGSAEDEENNTGSNITTPAPLEPKLDIASLKSEILTRGIEV